MEGKHLHWGGADTVELSRVYGTPLYVLSEDIIRSKLHEIRQSFLEKWPETKAFYAGKAFLTLAMARIVESEGFGLDLVSGGEIYTAVKAGFPMERTLFHGSAKSENELNEALDAGVGRIVVDNMEELSLIERLSEGRSGFGAKKGEDTQRVQIHIRVAPGVLANTHAALQTAQIGGKFGLSLIGRQLEDAVALCLNSPHLELKGLHFHVGSQIHDLEAHLAATEIIAENLANLHKRLAYVPEELDVGGGFGVSMTPSLEDQPMSFFTDAIMTRLERRCQEIGIQRPKVMIEPGRWVVSAAGITLYRIESVKEVRGMRPWVNVDGGMTDNPRPCLYNAKYSAVIANKASEHATMNVAVGGHCCETGDTLIESVDLADPQRGDLLALFSTGAYTFSMASNYNRLCRPAVVLVKEGVADLIVKRQTYDDLVALDLIPDRLR
jgi:diaminopimelate decarboxylase